MNRRQRSAPGRRVPRGSIQLIDVIHALLTAGGALAEHPAGWPLLVVFVYVIYACTRIAWDVFRAFTTFD